MKTYEITHETLRNQVHRDLDACESFNRNIDDALRGFSQDRLYTDGRSVVEAVRYNQQMLQVYTERTAAALELVGLFDADNDVPNLETLRDLYKKLSA